MSVEVLRPVSARRRVQGLVGRGAIGLMAFLSVAVLLWLLGTIAANGSRYLFSVTPQDAPAAIARAWNLPLLAAFATWGGGTIVLGAAAGWLLARLARTGPVAAALVRVVALLPRWLLGATGAWALSQVTDAVLQLSLLGAVAVGTGARMAVVGNKAAAAAPVPFAKAAWRPAAVVFVWMAGTFLALHLFNAVVSHGFLDNFSVPEYAGAENAGIKAAIAGTIWVGAISMAFAIPIGIMAAIYLNEFARTGPVTSFLRASIANLAGVPSVVFGILGLALFVRAMDLGASVAAAGMTLGLLTLPIVIVVSEEALKSVPRAMREAAFGLGASRWQAVRHHVLPYSLPGMLTGSILALSRTVGETAPLILIGAATVIDFTPEKVTDSFTAIPIQAYYWAENPNTDFQALAWGAVFVLIALVLAGNLAAILLRDRFQRRYRW